MERQRDRRVSLGGASKRRAVNEVLFVKTQFPRDIYYDNCILPAKSLSHQWAFMDVELVKEGVGMYWKKLGALGISLAVASVK